MREGPGKKVTKKVVGQKKLRQPRGNTCLKRLTSDQKGA